VAPKTRNERLRRANRRGKAIRKGVKVLLAVGALAAVLGAASYGLWQVPEVQSAVKSLARGRSAGGAPLSEQYREVQLEEAFDFAGGKITIESAHTSTGLRSAYGGGPGNEPRETFRPRNGVWLIVFLEYVGTKYADVGRMSSESVRLVDEDNNIYFNNDRGSPAQDVYIETSTTAYGRLRLNETAPQRSVLIFDVPKDARGLLLTFVRDEEGEMRVLYGAKISLSKPGKK